MDLALRLAYNFFTFFFRRWTQALSLRGRFVISHHLAYNDFRLLEDPVGGEGNAVI